MKKLYLVRHAKSTWKYEDMADVDRPLKGRGISDAYSTANWLLQQKEMPDLIISSPATRALHTALIFARTLNYPFSDVIINEKIYEASPNDLFEVVRSINDNHNSVMIFGHNPSLTIFVNTCIDHRIDNVPTTGMACLSFNQQTWKDLDKRAELQFFDYPKKRNK